MPGGGGLLQWRKGPVSGRIQLELEGRFLKQPSIARASVLRGNLI